jgi:hypothetical protein
MLSCKVKKVDINIRYAPNGEYLKEYEPNYQSVTEHLNLIIKLKNLIPVRELIYLFDKFKKI